MNEEKRETLDVEDDENHMGRTNLPDYGVPAGVQLTENIIEEIVEAVHRETPEQPVEKQ